MLIEAGLEDWWESLSTEQKFQIHMSQQPQGVE